jgi:hypothetical protein
MQSASEDDLERCTVKVNGWQLVKNNKRQKINTNQVDIPISDITISNRFNSLPHEEVLAKPI